MGKQATKQKHKVTPNLSLEPPRLFNVIYLNDEVTTMEFVVSSLMAIFDHSEEVANELTQIVHEQGSAIVGTYPYEIAEQKGVEVTLLARNNGFPLQVKLEQE